MILEFARKASRNFTGYNFSRLIRNLYAVKSCCDDLPNWLFSFDNASFQSPNLLKQGTFIFQNLLDQKDFLFHNQVRTLYLVSFGRKALLHFNYCLVGFWLLYKSINKKLDDKMYLLRIKHHPWCIFFILFTLYISWNRLYPWKKLSWADTQYSWEHKNITQLSIYSYVLVAVIWEFSQLRMSSTLE